MDAVVTTSRRARPRRLSGPATWPAAWGSPTSPCEGSIEALGAKAVLVVTKERLVVETAAGPLFFHPGMARPRIRSLERGEA